MHRHICVQLHDLINWGPDGSLIIFFCFKLNRLFLVSVFKKWVNGKKFDSGNDIMFKKANFNHFDKGLYLTGLKTLEKHTEKCVELQADFTQ